MTTATEVHTINSVYRDGTYTFEQYATVPAYIAAIEHARADPTIPRKSLPDELVSDIANITGIPLTMATRMMADMNVHCPLCAAATAAGAK